MESPVLLITFNRPETTRIVLDVLRTARIKTLYIFNDGPRPGNSADLTARRKIEEYVTSIDWECKTKIYFSETNLGCGIGVSSAISWAFLNEDRLIILEDDCVPVSSFFHYCDYLLEKFKDDTRVCMISGNNYSNEFNATDESYFFSIYGHIWGWATWKRVWNKYDYFMNDWPQFRDSGQLNHVFIRRNERKYMKKLFDGIYKMDNKGTWDYQWFFCRIKEYGLSIIPQSNLVSNIGVEGIHTNSKTNAHFYPANDKYSISKEPLFILCNEFYDRNHFKKIINQQISFSININKFWQRLRKKTNF